MDFAPPRSHKEGMDEVHFTKMHGAGNDFVVIDARRGETDITGVVARALADRHTGIGCDQVIVIAPPIGVGTEAFMRIFNADGGEVEACGNAARCVARLLMDESGTDSVAIATLAGPILAELGPDTMGAPLITVDMGVARTDWRDIPLAEEIDTLHLPIEAGALSDPVAVSMGNPHAVFFVEDADAIDLAALGPGLETHPLFPKRANIGICQVLGETSLRLRVWERGAGITRACGTGACAALVAAHRRALAGRAAEVQVDGGFLHIAWRGDGHVLMTGPAAISFTGTVTPGDLAAMVAA